MLPRSLTFTCMLLFFFTAAYPQPWPEKTTDLLNKSYQDIADMETSRRQWEANIQARNELFAGILQAVRELNDAAKAEANRIMAGNLNMLGREVIQPIYKKRDTDIYARYNLARLYLLEPKFTSYGGLGQHDYSYWTAMKDMFELALNGHGPAQYVMATMFIRKRDSLATDIFMRAAAQKLQPEAIGYFQADPVSVQYKPLVDSLYSFPPDTRMRDKAKKELKEKLTAQVIETGDYLGLREFIIRNVTLAGELFRKDYQKDQELSMKGKFIMPQALFAAYSLSFSSEVNFTRYRYDELKHLIEEKEKKGQPAWGERKMLADVEIGIPLYQTGEFPFKGLWWVTDSAASFSNYKRASEHGNPEAAYKLALCYKYGIGTPKDAARAFPVFKNLAESGYRKAYAQLAECYEKGNGTAKDREKSLYNYSRALQSEDYLKAMKAFSRLRFEGLNNMPVFRVNAESSEILDVIENEEAPVRILHFWHEGISAEEYRKTALLARHFSDIGNRKFRLFFATTSQASDILAEGMGYRGIAYYMRPPKQSPGNKPLYEAYEKKWIGQDNMFREKLLDRIGNICPDFDSRWSTEGLPATFVYIKGEREPYYFSASAPVEDIIRFVQEKTK